MGQNRDLGHWLTVTELARERGVDKSAVSRRVKRLEAQGALKTKAGPGGSKLISVAEFDRAIGGTDGGVGPDDAPGSTDRGDPVLAKEQARRTAYQADLARLDLDERLKNLLRRDHVREAHAQAAGEMGRILDALPARLDDILAAVASGGKLAGRTLLRDIAAGVRTALARAVDPATTTPETEPEPEA